MTTLRLTDMRAKGLRGVDKSGTSDPYIVAMLGTEKFTSKPLSETLNPVWIGEKFTFNVKTPGQRLIIQLMDRNSITKDKPLGNCEIETASLVPGMETPLTVPVIFERAPAGEFAVKLLLTAGPAPSTSSLTRAPSSVTAAASPVGAPAAAGAGAPTPASPALATPALPPMSAGVPPAKAGP